jgi:RNA polymerase sigma factor (sigma-70 family)
MPAFVRGDPQTFEAFYDRYAPAIARFAWSVAPSLDAAQDLVQETFLTAWRRGHSIRMVGDSALPWLLTTCRNHARNRARKERKWLDLLELREESIAADASAGAAANQLRWALEALDNLPDGERQVCELCLLHGLTYREAADRLGVSETAVGKRLQRAGARMREEAEL